MPGIMAAKHGDIMILGSLSYVAPLFSVLVFLLAGFGVYHWSVALACILITRGAVIAARGHAVERSQNILSKGRNICRAHCDISRRVQLVIHHVERTGQPLHRRRCAVARLIEEIGITDREASELISFLGLDWGSLVREARVIIANPIGS